MARLVESGKTWPLTSAAALARRTPLNRTTESSLKANGQSMVLSRDVSEKHAPAAAPTGAALSADERNDLLRLTGERIRDTNLPFYKACESKRQELREAAKQRGEMIKMICEIAFGFLAPGIVKGIGVLADIPIESSHIAYKAALVATDEERMKKVVEAASKPGLNALASSFTPSTKGVEDFLDKIEQTHRVGADAVSTGLSKLTDLDLGVMWAAYDPRVANDQSFKEAVEELVKKYQTQIEPIADLGRADRKAYDVEFPGNVKRLAVLGSTPVGDPDPMTGGSPRPAGERSHWFVTWISPEFELMAIEKTVRDVGKVETIRAESVSGLPTSSWFEVAGRMGGERR